MDEISNIKKKMESLDSSFPLREYDKEQIWNGIEQRLKKKGHVRTLYFKYAAAVAILVAFSAALYVKMHQHSHVDFTYSVEMVDMAASSDQYSNALESEAIEFIRSSCRLHQSTCESAEFIELERQLDELNMEMERLNNMISKYGEDELLIKSRIKIENYRSEVTRKLVQILMA